MGVEREKQEYVSKKITFERNDCNKGERGDKGIDCMKKTREERNKGPEAEEQSGDQAKRQERGREKRI